MPAQNPKPFRIKETGTPFINTYLPKEYGAHEQTYDIAQDAQGLLYFANVTGIIQFDGLTWSVDNRVSDDAFKDVAIGPQGRVFGVSRSEYGYFEPDNTGTLRFRSLIPKTPKAFKDIGSLTNVEVLGNQVIMRSAGSLLRYDIQKDTISLINARERYGQTAVVDGVYYAIDLERGLTRLEAGQLKTVPGGEAFKDLNVRKILRFDENELLVITKEQGLYKYDFDTLSPWNTAVSGFLTQAFGFTGINIHDAYFAIGTDRSGIVIIDREGKLIQKLDKTTGLPEGLVHGLMLDKDENLWVAQHGAISQVILNSPFTTIDERHGVNGYVLYFMKHRQITYVATTTGIVYKYDQDPWQKLGDFKAFKPLDSSMERTWMFVRKGSDFFALGNQGLWQIHGTNYRSLYRGERLWAVVVMKDKDRMILGSVEDHLHLFEKRQGQWQYISQIQGFNQAMDFLEQTEDGDIWMTDSGSGVFKIRLNESADSVQWIKKYGIEEGLPAIQRNRVFRHKKGLLFATAEGIYRYDSEEDRFQPAPEFNEHLGEDYVFRFAEMANGNIYASLNPRGKALLKPNAQGYELSTSPFQRIEGHNSEYVSGLGGNDIWIAGTGIKHYDHSFDSSASPDFQALIRSVNLSANDSLLYGGMGQVELVNLNPGHNAIRFGFSAAFYDKIEAMEFQSYLEGTEKTWSHWSVEPDRNYTNLPPGRYTFKLRARNAYGQVSEIDEYSFIIATPWHKSSAAYLLYMVLVGVMVWLIVKLYARRLEKEKLALEKVVSERTEEIRLQKESAERDRELIQQQADRLKALDKVKSRFFANISHELRTPLTLINAPLETLIQNGDITDPEIRHTLETARRNGVSLLSLVEEILDLAKLDAGKLKLVENPVLLHEFLTNVLDSYESGFDKKEIDVHFDFQPDQGLTLLMDENKSSKVLKNLLSNALKFTPLGGKVVVSVKRKSGNSDYVVLSVSDTGRGIHANDLPHIFDRYYQSEQPGKKAEGGTGIGLALAKELATLHGGSLRVTSKMGEGTTFVFEFPLREVENTSVKSLTRADHGPLKVALEETIGRYQQAFEIEKPILLITEDNPDMRHFVASALQVYFEVKQAENGRQAMEVLKNNAVDIVISDVMMPVMDGFELLEAIRQDEQLHEVSVVMLTARADEEDKLFALTLGIDDYLTKPFSTAEFLARIKNILDNRIKIILSLRQLQSKTAVENEHLTEWMLKHDLSEREVDVFKCLYRRYTNAQIAEELHISANTVKFHIKNLYVKLEINSRAEITKLAGELIK